jgi:hypothetical protein
MKKTTRDDLARIIEMNILGRTASAGAAAAADAIIQQFKDDTSYPDSFANQPRSVLEERAYRAEGGAYVWTVRDALLSALRDVDSGANTPEGFVLDECQVILVATGPNNDTVFRYYRRVKSLLSGLGILDTARFDTHREAQG